jgi:hypothetical protein
VFQLRIVRGKKDCCKGKKKKKKKKRGKFLKKENGNAQRNF